LIVAGNLLLGVAVMHLPFIYDAYHRHSCSRSPTNTPISRPSSSNRAIP
jgi:hypothetical protein